MCSDMGEETSRKLLSPFTKIILISVQQVVLNKVLAFWLSRSFFLASFQEVWSNFKLYNLNKKCCFVLNFAALTFTEQFLYLNLTSCTFSQLYHWKTWHQLEKFLVTCCMESDNFQAGFSFYVSKRLQLSSLDAKILRTVISVLHRKSNLAENKPADFKLCNWDRTTVVFHSGSSDHINIFAEAKALEAKIWTWMIAMFYHTIKC